MSELIQKSEHIHPAKYFKKDRNGILCMLCPHKCFLKSGQIGICKSRKNIDGILYALNYGNLCAVHVDPIEKKPLYHFLPGSRTLSIATGGCNLKCLNCQNWQISQKSPEQTSILQFTPDEIVDLALKENCTSISYTYTEPLIAYEFVYDTALIARQKGIKNVFVTAGYINQRPLKNLCEVMDAVNIDLKGFDAEIYKKLNGANLQEILDNLLILKHSKVWVEITNLIIPGWTDNLDVIKKMCDWLIDNEFENNPIHFSRFMPTYKLNKEVSTSVSILHIIADLAIKRGLNYVYSGNLHGDIYENTYCDNCRELLIKRQGYQVYRNQINNGICISCNNKIQGIWG